MTKVQKLVYGTATLFLLICGFLPAEAQEKLRRIDQPPLYQYPNVPVLVDVKFDDREMPERTTIAGADWLHRLSLDVSNVSRKNIKALRIDLILRDGQTAPDRKTVAISLELMNSSSKRDVFSPGDRVTLKPTAQSVDHWMGYLKERGVSDVERIILDVRQVSFTDGTGWFMGRQMQADPDSGRLRPVPENASQYKTDPVSVLFPHVGRSFFLS